MEMRSLRNASHCFISVRNWYLANRRLPTGQVSCGLRLKEMARVFSHMAVQVMGIVCIRSVDESIVNHVAKLEGNALERGGHHFMIQKDVGLFVALMQRCEDF